MNNRVFPASSPFCLMAHWPHRGRRNFCLHADMQGWYILIIKHWNWGHKNVSLVWSAYFILKVDYQSWVGGAWLGNSWYHTNNKWVSYPESVVFSTLRQKIIRPNKKILSFPVTLLDFLRSVVRKIIFLWKKVLYNIGDQSPIKNFGSELFDIGRLRHWKRQYFLLGLSV